VVGVGHRHHPQDPLQGIVAASPAVTLAQWVGLADSFGFSHDLPLCSAVGQDADRGWSAACEP